MDPDAVLVAADDASLERGFFVVADEHDVAGLGVECRVIAAWSVADPGLHDEVGSDGGGVVPEVVLAGAHVRQWYWSAVFEDRVGDGAAEQCPDWRTPARRPSTERSSVGRLSAGLHFRTVVGGGGGDRIDW